MSETHPSFHSAFEHHLGLTLDLESNGKKASIVSSHIERFNLNLHSYGHTCAIQFSAFGNEIDPLFTAPDVIKATLTLKEVDPHTKIMEKEPCLEVKGIVTEKCFKRIHYGQGGNEKPLRLYEITVNDNAKATWSHHFPINIYVDQSMKDVIEKQHINPEISLKMDWDKLETKQPIIAFSLPHQDWLPESQQVSFYSFLCWFLQKENGLLAYDYKANSYSILGKKSKAEGKPLGISEGWVEPAICIYPQTIRYNTKKRKHTFDSSESEDKDNPKAFKAVRRETIASDNYRCFPEQAYEEIQSILAPEKNIIEVDFVNMSEESMFDKLTPGCLVSFIGDKVTGATWSNDSCFKEKKFRVQSLYMQADKLGSMQEIATEVETFRTQVKVILEEEEEMFVPRPAFLPPVYPFAIQGKIFSDVGDKEQSTYKILESEKAPQGQYLVQIPIVEGDKKVVVPFTPDFMSGQFFYPYTKGQRVELSIYLHTAKILRPSDWQALARLPAGIQGNQIVLASNGKDKYVIIRHEFVDGKNSVLTIKQSTSEKETQLIQIKDNDLILSVEEKDKKTIAANLNKDKGFVISLDDKSASVTHQIASDGKTLTTSTKDSKGTSTVVQKGDALTIDCKEFTVNSDKINLNAKDVINGAGKNKVCWTTKVAEIAANDVKMGR